MAAPRSTNSLNQVYNASQRTKHCKRLTRKPLQAASCYANRISKPSNGTSGARNEPAHHTQARNKVLRALSRDVDRRSGIRHHRDKLCGDTNQRRQLRQKLLPDCNLQFLNRSVHRLDLVRGAAASARHIATRHRKLGLYFSRPHNDLFLIGKFF